MDFYDNFYDNFPCYICGISLAGDRSAILANGRRVPRGLSWRTRCSAEDFSKIVFRNQEVWGTFIRARIAQESHGLRVIVPKDRNLAVLGFPCLGGRSCKFVEIEPSLSMVGYPRAHLIHARCWELIERLFGCEAEKNLKMLLNIFQERWIDRDSKTKGNACYDFLREDMLLWRGNPIAKHDPVKILHLRAVIEESIQRPQKESLAYEAFEPSAILLDIKQTAISHIFPCEIQWMIIDLLNYKDAIKVLRAFGWVLSSSYWSRRFPKDLVFELDDLMKDDTEIDWQFLTLGVEKLLQRSRGLLNRRRLLPVLRKARDLFHGEVAKQQHN